MKTGDENKYIELELSFVIFELSFLSRFTAYCKSCEYLFSFWYFISFPFIYCSFVSFAVGYWPVIGQGFQNSK